MIKVYWADSQKTILRLDYIEVKSWGVYQVAIDDAAQLALSVNHKVYMLHNPGDISMPAGNPIEQLLIASKKIPPNVDIIVMVVTNSLAHRLVNVALFISNQFPNYKVVKSVEEAEAYLSELSAFN